ncbi:hypothetical protein [Enterococcus innesii]|uniref:hypothetical protein n=1 Tax=Enterococcus innesii TaxID=2839759 RepID=UPI00232C0DCC|nr:hypothetical protein [Enterococcus innesii]MDC0751791.1 hypothetical protein [Enterococcus innesii]MDC0775879.1 hypothetical protein [Enterococcus innesii]MDC0778857.1 hypothetical protein [Enterococcus innesii]MDC0782740.1 hypothetical protein [Enterococcus innesii]
MASDEMSQKLLTWDQGSIEEIVSSISNAFRLFGASMDEAVLNIQIKQSRDPRVKKYHQIYRRTKKSRLKRKQLKKIKAIL